MPTTKQDRDFAESMQGNIDEIKMSLTTLDNAVEWMQDNLQPEDVFDEKHLVAWAESNGYVKE